MAIFKKCRHVARGDDPKLCGCSWYAQFRIAGGAPKSFRLGPDVAKARAENKRLEREYQADRGVGMVRRAKDMTLKQAVDEFMAMEGTRDLAPGTMAANRTRYGAMMAYFGEDTPLSQINQHDIVAWRKDCRNVMAISYEREVFAAARRLMAWAVHEDRLEDYPWPMSWPGVPKHKRKKKKPRHHPLPDMRRALDLTNEEYRGACELMMLTSMRVAEVLGLTADDFVMDGGKPVAIRIANQFDIAVRERVGRTKTVDSERDVGLTPRARKIVEARLKHVKEHPTDDGRLWSYVHHTVNKWWQRGQVAAGLSPKLGTHALRHAFRTAAEQSGMNDREIAALMGHGDRIEWSRNAYGTGGSPKLSAKGLRALDKATGA